MKLNIPTLLTWLRILLIPIFVGAFYWPENLRTLGAMPSHSVKQAEKIEKTRHGAED